LKPPTTTCAVSVLPTESHWQPPSPHIDHSIEKDAFKTFPPPFRIGCLIYLNQVREHAGGTVVWPASHLQIAALAQANPEKYEYLSALNRDVGMLSLQNPVEIIASAGDVLFYHRFCIHAGSMNTGTEPRLALTHKW
jgi:ectoine hydroxylase-related dioxygenase (phytanoyl-CoA dioxygenase family)